MVVQRQGYKAYPYNTTSPLSYTAMQKPGYCSVKVRSCHTIIYIVFFCTYLKKTSSLLRKYDLFTWALIQFHRKLVDINTSVLKHIQFPKDMTETYVIRCGLRFR